MRKLRNILVLGSTVAVLMGATAESRLLRKAPVDAQPYHERVAAAAARAPMNVGDWVGQDVPTPPAAVRLLRPNVILSRHFVNYVTGDSVHFLLVQCSDARDLIGHFPPVCYPGQGWMLLSSAPRNWHVGDLTVEGTQYEFAVQKSLETARTVANFMVLPGGGFGRDMDSVRSAARNLQKRYYGAAQVQVLMPSTLPQEQKDQIVRELVAAHREVIAAIREESNTQ